MNTKPIDVPARNRAVKELLKQTYPGTTVRVTAGKGTAYHWIYIFFGGRVGNPPGMTHNRVDDAIADLIVGAGIHVFQFNRSDDDRDMGKLPCITITMPRTPQVDLTRNAVADTITDMMKRSWPVAKIDHSLNTSNCPLIRMEWQNGETFHVTVTRARKGS